MSLLASVWRGYPNSGSGVTGQFGVTVTIWICIMEVSDSNLGQDIIYPD
jgi:hypothetical protein